jgi:hypothetical protein
MGLVVRVSDSGIQAMSRKRRIWNWVRFTLRCLVTVACVVLLLSATNVYALVLPVLWTVAWTSGIAEGVRRVRRNSALAGTQTPHNRKLPTPLLALVGIVAFFWLFGWAIVVGLVWGPIAGMAALFLGFVTARTTIVVADLARDYGDVYSDFTLNDDGETNELRLSTASRLWTIVNRPLPRNIQLIAVLSLAVIVPVIIATRTHWPWWSALGLVLIWVRQCLLMVRKIPEATKGLPATSPSANGQGR